VVVLYWLYYAAQILFFGAEFTKFMPEDTAPKLFQIKNAIPLTEEARLQQGMKPNQDQQAVECLIKPRSPNFIGRLFRRFTQSNAQTAEGNHRY